MNIQYSAHKERTERLNIQLHTLTACRSLLLYWHIAIDTHKTYNGTSECTDMNTIHTTRGLPMAMAWKKDYLT